MGCAAGGQRGPIKEMVAYPKTNPGKLA